MNDSLTIPSPSELLDEMVQTRVRDLRAQSAKSDTGEAILDVHEIQQVVVDRIERELEGEFEIKVPFVATIRQIKIAPKNRMLDEKAVVQMLLKRCLSKIRNAAFRTDEKGNSELMEVALQEVDTDAVTQQVMAQLKEKGWQAEVDSGWISLSPANPVAG